MKKKRKYINIHFLGDSKESNEFAKQFLERRSKFKNIQRAKQAHNDDLCQPAPAVNPGIADFTEVKVSFAKIFITILKYIKISGKTQKTKKK